MANNYTPAPGIQQPDRYSVPVGPNYKKYGEQKGWVYVPQLDRYYIDPKSVQDQYKNQGLIEDPPKEPGLAEQLLPIGATVGTATLASEGAKALPGLLGFGEKEAAAEVAKEGLSSAAFSAADQAALDAGVESAIAGGEGAAAGMFDIGGIGGAGNAILPGIGLIGAGDLILNKRTGARGIAQGAASGAAMGSWFGPTGALVGGGIGGLVGLGNSAINRKSTGEIQADRWEDAGHSELAGTIPDYFAGTGGEKSRDESLLTADSIRVNPDNYNNIPDWDSWSKAEQDQFLKTMLDNKKVREKKGGVYYDDDFAKATAENIKKQRTGGLIGI